MMYIKTENLHQEIMILIIDRAYCHSSIVEIFCAEISKVLTIETRSYNPMLNFMNTLVKP